jgi:hypothetical protein
MTKKELMHENQFVKDAGYVSRENIQLVVFYSKGQVVVSVLDKADIVVNYLRKANCVE